MLKKMSLLVISLAALTMIGSCAAPVTKWNHPSANDDQWAVDKAGCRSRARHISDKEHAAEQNYANTRRDDEFTADYSKNMQTFDSRRRRQDLYENCLRRLGYAPAKD